MNDTFAVAYVSSAVHLLSEAELEALLLSARDFNAKHDVTGILLYHEGTFFQYFEGPGPGVEAVYSRVRESRLNGGLMELMRERVEQHQFSNWGMGFSAAPQSLILALERAHWLSVSKQVPQDAELSDGLGLLLQFWRGAHRGFA